MSCVIHAFNSAHPHMRAAFNSAETHMRNAYNSAEPHVRNAINDVEPQIRNAVNKFEPQIRNTYSSAEPHIRNAYEQVEPHMRAAADANIGAMRAAADAAYACTFPRSLPHAMGACSTAATASAMAAAQTATLGVSVATNGARATGNVFRSASAVPSESPAAVEDTDLELAIAHSLEHQSEEAELKLAIAMSLAEAGAITASDGVATAPLVQPAAVQRATDTALKTPAAHGVDDDLARLDDASSDDGASDDGVLVNPSDVEVATVQGTPLGDPFPSVPLAREGVEWDEWEQTLLDDLQEMGFLNTERNAELLRKHDGDLKRTVRELVELRNA